MSSIQSPYEELYDRVNKTTKSRFHSQRRLNHHNWASLLTITLFSVCLLVLPLAKAFGIELNASEKVIDFVQSLLAIVILVVSVILSMANFAVRAEKIHSCEMELNSLLRRIYPKKSHKSEADEDYEEFSKEYDEILYRYENHKKIDHMHTVLAMSDYYKPSWWYRPTVALRYFLEFWTYATLISLVLIWVAYITLPYFKVSIS